MKRILTIALLIPLFVNAQQLSLRNAIDSAMKNNFNILFAKDTAEMNHLSNTYGMAGGLPSVNIATGDNNLLSNVHQHYSTGPDLDKNNVYGNSLTGAITASIPLFNGFKIVATKHQLEALEALGDLQLNQRIQNTMAAIMMKYYDIVRQDNYMGILHRSLDVSKEKLNITTTRRSVGMANDADFLQAQIDESTIEQTIKSQQLVIDQTKADLQVLMSSKSFYPFSVTDTIVVDKGIVLDSITGCLKQNPQYLSFDQIIKINETVVQQINSQRYPSLKINTAYNFSYTNSGAGYTIINQIYGPQAGFTLQIPIYNGNMFKTQHDVAVCNVTMAKQQQQSLLLAYNADAYKTYISYQNTLQQLTEQQANYERSGTLVKIVMQRFQNNLATMLDVKAAQLSFENSGFTLVNLEFAAKAAEVELKRLVYKLK
jgi:outer membrane protein TolC